MLETILYVWLLLLANVFVGAVVLWAIDRDGKLYEWYDSCPRRIAPIVQPAILFFWPVVMYFYWKSKHVDMH